MTDIRTKEGREELRRLEQDAAASLRRREFQAISHSALRAALNGLDIAQEIVTMLEQIAENQHFMKAHHYLNSFDSCDELPCAVVLIALRRWYNWLGNAPKGDTQND